MSIPVYGLSGIDGVFSKILKNVKKSAAATNTAYRTDGRSFGRYISKIKDPARRLAITEVHRSNMRGLEGIYNTAAQKIGTGTATQKDAADFKKARVLIALADTDYDAYRLASIYMPYVVDIDEQDGGYIFPTQELADVAAWGEEQVIDYLNRPGATELGLQGLLSKIKKTVQKVGNAVGNAAKTVVKTVANTATAAAKSTVNAVKATANVVKAGAQAVTGNTSGAKKTILKAGTQAKSAIVNPVKQAVSDTKATAKAAGNVVTTMAKGAVDIMKETVKIAGKVFKVLFIKINPVTVLIRNSLRGLLALNFLGFASRLGVGMLTQAQAEAQGYSVATWQKAKDALAKVKKLYGKMGGNVSKLEKSIKNGAQKKALMNAKGTQKVNFAANDDAGETTLGEAASIAAMIASCVGILTSIWAWIKSIVADKKAQKEADEQKKKQEEQRKYNEEHYELDANGNVIVDQYGRPVPKGQIDADKKAAAATAATQDKKPVWPWIVGGIALLGGGALLMSNKKKSKRR